MACCGGNRSRPQRIRKQVIDSDTSAATPTQRKLKRTASVQPASIQRQYVVPRQQCVKCGYPGMVVIIAGRERMQCSNVNCRLIIS